ncbi:glycoside hydrolase family 16 protein [Clostridium weizhouense]|uniref:Family 16 glycosylhydrolase n=1 Tax=Clostridium weizhouense TaxID=2859781 RepID=A0ABS7AR26_9CLOT|nr:glycoside hydrolase family 16 protein [Clostridium weizhouense]MBW6411126.1 family 16 glycosylhydrolase [Clostridium weizhouense]
MRYIKNISALIALTLIINLSIVFSNVSANEVDSNEWKLVWSDEFNDRNVNTSNWTYDIDGHGWGNNELQYYTDREENARIEDGNLVIQAKKEDFNGSKYTSARLKSEGLQEFTYGKIEARIKLPSDKGLWPAFWMLGANMSSVKWPNCGEIDIMEHVNTENKIYGTLHWNDKGAQSFGNKFEVDVTEYHTYSIEWNPNTIKWFVDGVQYEELSIANNITGNDEFHKPFFILLNLAVGGNWPQDPDLSTNFPAKMYVDYVRVYKNVNDNLIEHKTRNGWFKDKKNQCQYYLDDNSTPVKGWVYNNNNWYYLDNECKMRTGWINPNTDWYYLNDSGEMQTGWQKCDGKLYYFDNNGAMLKNTIIQGRKLGTDGNVIE